MPHFQKLRTISIIKWVSSNVLDNPLKAPFWQMWSFHIAPKPRLYRTKRAIAAEISNEMVSYNSASVAYISRAARRVAQAALFEYLHCTRCLPFMDAENMSRNSPHFLNSLLKSVEHTEEDEDIGQSITRFLRYHPINEFEPFFESLGLKPSEYVPVLPRGLMFLTDDRLLLENYQILCNYGIERSKIGKIYKEAVQVFQYEFGVLSLKLGAYEELGLSKSFMKNVIVCSPHLLMGHVDADFVKVLEMLKSMGFEYNWIEENLLEQNFYTWRRIHRVLCFFTEMGFGGGQLHALFTQHPGLLFEGSGDMTFSLIGFLLKFGFAMDQINSLFLHFPKVQVGQFVSNLSKCFIVLCDIQMKVCEIRKIVCSHSLLLGLVMLKKTNSLLANLNVGKKRLCKYIQENPQELSKLVLGSELERLPKEEKSVLKIKFLLDLGYGEDPQTMKRALKVFRGSRTELQERFDFIVNHAGLDKKEVSRMIKVSPQILNMSKDAIRRKIDFLVNELGYPISTLVIFPSYLNYKTQRVKLRLSMYDWLKDEEKVEPGRALSTIVGCSEKVFKRTYINQHPRGAQVWENLKKQICSE